MTNEAGTRVPVPGELVVRKIPFDFPDDLEPDWKPDEPERSHMVNGYPELAAIEDAMQASYDRMWVLGVFTGSLHVIWYARRGYVTMLKKDGLWSDLRSKGRS